MLKITDKIQCCGCTACFHACPVHCITMEPDNEGFRYPVIDMNRCIDCGKCERVCPIINRNNQSKPETCLAAKNPDNKIRLESSSGGVFTAMALRSINNGGIVVGARFGQNHDVEHYFAETPQELSPMRGSKYVQSRLGDTFPRIKKLLGENREVLFSGTPCQVSGLLRYLGKNHTGLTTIDTVCHGVPSPEAWRSYLSEITATPDIEHISFRSKISGWKHYSIIIGDHTTAYTDDPYMQSFLSNINLRPSCYGCPAKCGRSGADITLGDFWGIDRVAPEFDDDRGVNLIIPHTEKGRHLIGDIHIETRSLPYSNASAGNPSLETSVSRPAYRDYFFHYFNKHGFTKAWNMTSSKSIFQRIHRRFFLLTHT